MRYFIDTEFNWDPFEGRITPISIGIVDQDGREFYAVDANWSNDAQAIPSFVDDVVVPALVMDDDFPPCYVHGERATIARDLKAFIGDDIPQFIGEYSAFDYVVLSMLIGSFDQWPRSWPMYVRDIAQESLPESTSARPHNALADARAVRDTYNWSYFGVRTDGREDDIASLVAQVLAAGPPIDPTP